jgi:hypothetical protein
MIRALVIAAAAAGIYYLYQRNLHRPSRSRVALPQGVRARIRDGVLTLSGTATSAERDRILALALKQPGVQRVVNQLELLQHADVLQ